MERKFIWKRNVGKNKKKKEKVFIVLDAVKLDDTLKVRVSFTLEF